MNPRRSRQDELFSRYGDGLVAILPPRAGAGERGRGFVPPHGGAFVHVGVDGVVHAFGGKVEVGQGTHATLALLVAEELRVPLASVQLVLGDTDVDPWDMGTFGSMSMPVAGPALRAAAAAAREALAKLDGGFRNKRIVVDAHEGKGLTPADHWTIAGRSTPALDAKDAVTGARVFVTDVHLAGMLHGAILHPPAYGATLVRADVTKARAHAGVVDVIVDQSDGGPAFVGAVAHDSISARAALLDVDAEWKTTKQPKERDIDAYLRAHPSAGEGFWGPFHHEIGDVARAKQSCAVVVEATYRAAYIAHVPLEPRCAVASWENDGARLTIHVGTQTPFAVRDEVAEAFGLDEEHVRVVVPAVGAGYGGKHAGDVAIAAAKLARAAKKPVRIEYTREEEFTWGYFRPMALIDVRARCAADGTITSWEATNLNSGSSALVPPYDIANQRIDHQPSASPLPQGPYRGLAATANTFARESMIDELAQHFGVDPLDYRVRHLKGDDRLRAVLVAAAERAQWSARPAPGKTTTRRSGAGIACSMEKGGRVATVAHVDVDDAGRVRVTKIVTAFECGAVVNPDNLENQIVGATIMGLGGALFEAVHFDDGRIKNPKLSLYRVPRFSDVPPIEVVIIDRKDLPSAGAGETPLVAVAPAIASAIFAATGVRHRALPLAPK
jgi:isoquinoline 1-oxidoreductase